MTAKGLNHRNRDNTQINLYRVIRGYNMFRYRGKLRLATCSALAFGAHASFRADCGKITLCKSKLLIRLRPSCRKNGMP